VFSTKGNMGKLLKPKLHDLAALKSMPNRDYINLFPKVRDNNCLIQSGCSH
jgi:hypothetical protein